VAAQLAVRATRFSAIAAQQLAALLLFKSRTAAEENDCTKEGRGFQPRLERKGVSSPWNMRSGRAQLSAQPIQSLEPNALVAAPSLA